MGMLGSPPDRAQAIVAGILEPSAVTTTRFGLSCALATPFNTALDIDVGRMVAHARDCLARGCDSVTLFGTTGEGASIGLSARGRVLDAMCASGIDARRQLLSTVAASSLEDAADQATLALEAGVCGILLTPPFYFRNADDEALYAWFGHLFDRLGGRARDMLTYHLPSVTGISLSVTLIDRLKRAFPGIVVGVKDSSATWTYTDALLHAHSDLMILVGDERDLARAVRAGGSGAISGLANIAPEILLGAATLGRDDARIRPLVDTIASYPVLPSVKVLIAHRRRDTAWTRMRPPLTDLDAASAATLVRDAAKALAMEPA
jgi:4-hydroxy-tetrahydrodipicolinate synthase